MRGEGCLSFQSLALTWIDNGMKQTPEEMAVLAGEIIMHGVKVLETKA